MDILLNKLMPSATLALVSQALRREPESCESLSRYVYSQSNGNAFSATRILADLHRQQLVKPISSVLYFMPTYASHFRSITTGIGITIVTTCAELKHKITRETRPIPWIVHPSCLLSSWRFLRLLRNVSYFVQCSDLRGWSH